VSGLPLSDAARQTLEERARRLAQPLASADAADSIEMVVLPIGRERYGIEIRYLLEVMRGADIAPVPGTPEIVVGVVNRRGAILPVFDLRGLFGRPITAPSSGSAIVVLGIERAEFGLLADTGTETMVVVSSGIMAEAPFTGGKGQEIVKGTTADALVVLDGQALMMDSRLFVGSGQDGRSGGGD
jgi:purine-binding chemotaxis protein CheW